MSNLYIQGLKTETKTTDLLTNVFNWKGDELPKRVGDIPGPYNPSAGFKVYYHNVHEKGFFSYGPYLENESLGIMNVYFFMSATNKENGSSPAFTIDIVDAHNLNDPLVKRTFYINQLPSNSDGFIVIGNNIPIKPGQSIEARIIAEGGCDLQLFYLRIETSGL